MKPQLSHFEAQCLKTARAVLSNRELFTQSEVDAALYVMGQLAGEDVNIAHQGAGEVVSSESEATNQPTRRRFLTSSAAITAVAVLSVASTAALTPGCLEVAQCTALMLNN